MARSSVVKVRVSGKAAKLLRLYAKDHRISMGEFLEKMLYYIDVDEAFEETSDNLSIEQRKDEGPGISLDELMKKLKRKGKLK
jgi:hypothetical protein